jgi:glutamine phosphoribosylpyrophosphate amidotransferase
LGFLSLDGLIAATERDRRELCTGCFTGKYPPGIDEQLQSVVRPVEGVLADPAMRG